MDRETIQRLESWLDRSFGHSATIAAVTKLSGGAIQQNWLIEAVMNGQPAEFVLRKDAATSIGASHSRRDEFALLQVAHAAGVRVPKPIAFCDDASVLGGPFALMTKVDGVGFGPRIVKDTTLGGDRERLTAALGHELARIHAIMPDPGGIGHRQLPFLGSPSAHPSHTEIATLRGWLDDMGASRPALEWGLEWAARHAPDAARICLVHRDFRTGNYMVDGHGLTAVLDWEFAGWGDPMADLGWFCAACWRFGQPALEAGGIGARAAFYRGYRDGGGGTIDHASVRFWEIMAHIRWAVIALQQGERHSSGREFSLEHALTGRIAAELELAVLRLTAPPKEIAA